MGFFDKLKNEVLDIINESDNIQEKIDSIRQLDLSNNEKNNPTNKKGRIQKRNKVEAYEGFVKEGHPYIKFEVVENKSVGTDEQKNNISASNSSTPPPKNGILKYVKIPIDPDFMKVGYSFTYDIEDKFKDASDAIKKKMKEAADTALGTFASQNMKATVNPNMENFFKSVDFRKLSFTFELIPKNKNQDDQIEKIVEMFKYWSHPESVGNFFLYPEFWVIHYNSGTNNGTQGVNFKTKLCRCENITIEYGNSGGYTLFKTSNKPTSVRINISFTENEYITREDITKGY